MIHFNSSSLTQCHIQQNLKTKAFTHKLWSALYNESLRQSCQQMAYCTKRLMGQCLSEFTGLKREKETDKLNR